MNNFINELSKNKTKFQPNIIIGVYCLWDEDELVYIGKSIDIDKRVREHYTKQKTNYQFTHYSWIECDEQYLSDVEIFLIQFLKPKHNRQKRIPKDLSGLITTFDITEGDVYRALLEMGDMTIVYD